MNDDATWHDPQSDQVEDFMVRCLESSAARRERLLSEFLERHPEHATEVARRFEILRSLGVEEADVPVSAWSVPEQLGDFRLVRALGGGGMGIVYLAEQLSLGREVALKLIRPEHLLFPGARARFRREIEAVATLHHPGIVAIHTVGEEGALPFFAMELIDGCTLAEILADLRGHAPESLSGADFSRTIAARFAGDSAGSRGDGASSGRGDAVRGSGGEVFDPDWVRASLELVRQVAVALEHAHRKGIVHRDVKPSNVSVTRTGRAVLLDFGLAVPAGAEGLTQSGGQLGTLAYMSPEQVRGVERPGPATDVYSLGVTLYELLALQPPFQAEDRSATERLILAGQRRSLRARNPRVSAELELVCAKAMEADPRQRYPSAAAFADDLGRLLDRRPVLARPPGSWLRLRRWVQRNPARSAAVALAFLLASGVPSALFLQGLGHNRELQAAVTREKQRVGEREAVAEFLIGLFRDADPTRNAGASLSAEEILRLGIDQLDEQLHDQPMTRALVLEVLGRIYGNIGLIRESLPLLEEAVQLRRGAESAEDAALATALMSLGSAQSSIGDLESAERNLGEAHAIRARVYGADDWRTAITLSGHAAVRSLRGELDEALAWMRQAAEVVRTDPATSPGRGATVLSNLGSLLRSAAARRSGAERLALLEEAEAVYRETDTMFAREPGEFAVARLNARRGLATLLTDQQRWAEAELILREVLAEWQELVGGGRVPIEHRLRQSIGSALYQQGRYRDTASYGVESFRRALETATPDDPFPFQTGSSMVDYLCNLGFLEEAEVVLGEVPEMPEGLGERQPTIAARGLAQQAYGLACLGRLDEAQERIERSAAIERRQGSRNLVHVAYELDIALARQDDAAVSRILEAVDASPLGAGGGPAPSALVEWGRGRIAEGDGDFEAAAAHYRSCLEVWGKDGAFTGIDLPARILLGGALLRAGEVAEGKSLLHDAAAQLSAKPFPLDGLPLAGRTWLETCRRYLDARD